jgi:hypothetical protein
VNLKATIGIQTSWIHLYLHATRTAIIKVKIICTGSSSICTGSSSGSGRWHSTHARGIRPDSLGWEWFEREGKALDLMEVYVI